MKLPLVYCTEVEEFVRKIQELRGYPSLENLLYRLQIDEGQGKLMVSLSIIEWLVPESMSGKGKMKSSGVKRVFVLACAPAKENYENVKIMLEKIGLHNFSHEYKLAADCKFYNIFCGLGPHGSMFPCYVCRWVRGTKETGEKRTFASISSESAKMAATKGGEAKNHFRLLLRPFLFSSTSSSARDIGN